MIDSQGLLERKLRQAELFNVTAQLRDPARHSADQIHQLQARRRELLAGLEETHIRPEHVRPPLDSLTISPAVFDRVHGVFGLGTTGYVQVAPATENVNTFVAGGPWPHSGTINLISGTPPSLVSFNGLLNVGPDEVDQSKYDPTINYFWIHSWKYLVPFPAPTTTSMFTYSFDAYAVLSLFAGCVGNVSAFVSLGETANLTTGTTVTVNLDGGWPIPARDLNAPYQHYNGAYGFIEGDITVQRSFRVGGGQVPGVVIVVGVIVAVAMQSEVSLAFPGLPDSGFSVGSAGGPGRIAYAYEPELVMAPPN